MALIEYGAHVSVGRLVLGREPDHDSVLVAAYVTRGDEAAFSALVERHHRWVFRLVLSVLGPGGVGDAQDITQDVFVRVAGQLRDFRHESAFTTWLRRVALNLAIDRRRHARWRVPHVSLAALKDRRTANPNEDPHRSAEAKEKTRDVARSLWVLPEGIRKAIYLHYWMDLRPEEIAVRLQIPAGTVKSRLHRGRKMLRNIRVRVLATGGAGRQRAGRDGALRPHPWCRGPWPRPSAQQRSSVPD